MTSAISHIRAVPLAVLLLAGLGAAPARADRCEDIAKELARQITGLKIGRTVAGVIYLEHPAVKQASLGCSSKNRSNEVFASTDKRKPLLSSTISSAQRRRWCSPSRRRTR